MVWKIKDGEFSEIFLSELAAVIESSKSCKRSRSKVEAVADTGFYRGRFHYTIARENFTSHTHFH